MSLSNLPRDVVSADMRESKPKNFSGLKLSAAGCRESPIHKEVTSYSHRSHSPQQAAENALAPGFTLIELVIVVAIVGVLSAIAMPLYGEYIEKAKIVRAISEITTISKSLTAYYLENNKYPQSLDEVDHVAFIDPWGAPDFLLGTAIAADRAFLDPWGAPYQYLNIQTATTRGPGPRPRTNRFVHPINSDYDLFSMGKDGRSQAPLTAHASKDDIIRANDGGYIGLASDF